MCQHLNVTRGTCGTCGTCGTSINLFTDDWVTCVEHSQHCGTIVNNCVISLHQEPPYVDPEGMFNVKLPRINSNTLVSFYCILWSAEALGVQTSGREWGKMGATDQGRGGGVQTFWILIKRLHLRHFSANARANAQDAKKSQKYLA